MWKYEKKLQYPVNIKNVSPKNAQIIISQFGGPDGELGASMRYLTQRYSQPFNEVKGILTDIGTEELAHLEMVCAMVHQLTRTLTEKQIEESGFDKYFVDHTNAVFPQAASGLPWRAEYIASKGDILADLHEDLAAEGTIAKEQPAIQTSEKALFHAVFQTFALRTKNRRLRPHKNNKSQKHQ